MGAYKSAKGRLTLWKLATGSSLAELARKAGVSKQEVSHVASGRYGKETGVVVERVAKAMGCNPDWLVAGRGAAPGWAVDGDTKGAARIIQRTEEQDRVVQAALLLGVDADALRASIGPRLVPVSEQIDGLRRLIIEGFSGIRVEMARIRTAETEAAGLINDNVQAAMELLPRG